MHLLELELDGGLDLVELGRQVLGVGDRGRELAGWVCERAQISLAPSVHATTLIEAHPWRDRGREDEGSA